MRSIHHFIQFGVAAATALALSACGGGGGSSTSSTQGTLRLGLTDAPACGYDHVNVTIQKVRINQSATAADTDSGWTDITLDPALRVDLLTLTNGALTTLGQAPLAAGHYSQIRLVLAANDTASPLANSIVPTGGSEIALTTPSGQQSGLKLNADITIAADQMADFLLDFDACKSVVRAGNSGKYLLKPVISVIPSFISGVTGYVDPSLGNGGTLVSVQQAGAVVKATSPDATGKFTLEPVAPGAYDLVVAATGHVTGVLTGVPVADKTITILNTSSSAFDFTATPTGSVGGTITTATTPVDASVDALQTLGNGDVVDIATTNADADTGVYALVLPASAPVVAPYASAASSVSFAPDPAAGVNYTIRATSGGVSKSAQLAVSASAPASASFSF
ncbi:MAG TPA: DUF4382 domain-containing protein [Burkholderiaceae bacterium]